MKLPLSLGASAALALIWLGFLDSTAATSFLTRVLAVLSFASFMTIIVNISSDAGTFETLLSRVQPRRPASTWLVIVLLSLFSTVFFSLDTTAVLITPVAILLARNARIPMLPAALSVIWLANLGSMLLPISNLTNLLAVQTGLIFSTSEFLAYSWAPASYLAFIAAGTPLLLAGITTSSHHATARYEDSSHRVPRFPLTPEVLAHTTVIVVLLPFLLTPIPVWLSAGIAAAASCLIARVCRPHSVNFHIVPWGSMAFIFALTSWAALIHKLGLLDLLLHPLQSLDGHSQLWGLGIAGALAANLINNIPAYLALEPAANSPSALFALLLGVNAGPVISPWASLATLLWADQMKRRGETVNWLAFAALGLVLSILALGGSLWLLS
ncbi:arsenic transporter [Corynebacterium sp. 3HC-13]|uniref:SLC13 family permease n=1 Tax=Corynebacterium poyangense TaxID=2684405 RepID=UPI001CC9234C|nr:SLC13 family permease [Corynebacterium poyangense]MBZ8176855.1 arsenic transporter [Corynebacterium poyangense]